MILESVETRMRVPRYRRGLQTKLVGHYRGKGKGDGGSSRKQMTVLHVPSEEKK